MTDERLALADRLEQVAKLMRSARREHRNIGVWPDDLKAVEDAIVALRTASTAPDYAVKALTWTEYEREGDIDEWEAETIFGTFYSIKRLIFCFMPYHDSVALVNQGQQLPEEAMAVCQADYEQRIRSALVEQSATPSYAAAFEACRKAPPSRASRCPRQSHGSPAMTVAMREALIRAGLTSPDGTVVHAATDEVIAALQQPDAGEAVARALENAAIFLEIGAKHAPDDRIDEKIKSTGERLATRGLATVMRETAKNCREILALTGGRG